MSPSRGLPLWVKLAWTLWMAVWVPVYWTKYGPQNFLWLCDVGVFLVGAALWLESPMLFSAQACGLLVIQLGWIVDVLAALSVGIHPIGGTEYMFNPGIPMPVRLLSLFHVAMPPVLLWGIARLGYDPRGWKLQTAIVWLVLPVCYVGFDANLNINWVWGPFGKGQTAVAPGLYFAAVMVAYPALLFLPTHLLLRRSFSRRPAAALLNSGA